MAQWLVVSCHVIVSLEVLGSIPASALTFVIEHPWNSKESFGNIGNNWKHLEIIGNIGNIGTLEHWKHWKHSESIGIHWKPLETFGNRWKQMFPMFPMDSNGFQLERVGDCKVLDPRQILRMEVG